MNITNPRPGTVAPAFAAALLDHLTSARETLRSAVERVSREHRETSPAGRWSVAGILEHLAISEDRIVRLLLREIEALPRDVAVASEDAVPEAGPVADRTRRVIATDWLEPTGTFDAQRAWTALERSRVGMRRAVDAAIGRPLRGVRVPHPFLGPLDLVQWIAFVGHHERRHADQIRELAGEVDGEQPADGLLARVDHLVYGGPDLATVCARLEVLFGVRPAPGGRHPMWATHNAILAVGPRTYIEAIAPDQAAGRPASLFGLDALDEPRLVAWAANTIDFSERGALCAGDPLDGRRRRDDGSELAWRMTDPAVVRTADPIPFLLDWGDTPHPAATAPRAGTLIELQAVHPDGTACEERLARSGLPLRVGTGSAATLRARFDTVRGTVELI